MKEIDCPLSFETCVGGTAQVRNRSQERDYTLTECKEIIQKEQVLR